MRFNDKWFKEVLVTIKFKIYQTSHVSLNEGEDITSYADDNTHYFCGSNLDTIIDKLES